MTRRLILAITLALSGFLTALADYNVQCFPLKEQSPFGSVTPSFCGFTSSLPEEEVTFTATPKEGYVVYQWRFSCFKGGNQSVTKSSFYPSNEYTLKYDSAIDDGVECELWTFYTNKEVTATLNANGGACDAKTTTVRYNLAYGALPQATRAGYDFKGWTTKKDDESSLIKASDKVPFTSDFTLYAFWNAKVLTVTLNANGGTCSTNSILVTVAKNYAALEGVVPTKAGSKFLGWFTDDDVKVTYSSTVNATKDHTLTAKWEDVVYAVTLDRQGSSSGTPSTTATYGKPLSSITPPEKEGYAFQGYYAEKNGGGTRYIDANGVGCTDWNLTSDTTLYAYWKANVYSAALDAQGGVQPEPTTLDATYGSVLPTITPPTRAGYTYGGYFSRVSGGGTQYIATNGTGSCAYDIVGNTTLFAKWTGNPYAVQFKPNGGIGNEVTTNLTYGDIFALPGKGFFAHYTADLTGWSNGVSGVTYPTNAIVSNLVTRGSVALYAIWQSNINDELTKAAKCVRIGLNSTTNETKWVWTTSTDPLDATAACVKSGTGTSDSSILRATVTGTGVLTFKWYAAAYTGPLKPTFKSGDVVIAEIATKDTGKWISVEVPVTSSGENVFRWVSPVGTVSAAGGRSRSQIIDLYVKDVVWTADNLGYTIHFEPNEGTGTMEDVLCDRDTVYQLPQCAYTRAGKRFAGWECSNGRRYDDGILVFNLGERGATVTMTAVWE